MYQNTSGIFCVEKILPFGNLAIDFQRFYMQDLYFFVIHKYKNTIKFLLRTVLPSSNKNKFICYIIITIICTILFTDALKHNFESTIDILRHGSCSEAKYIYHSQSKRKKLFIHNNLQNYFFSMCQKDHAFCLRSEFKSFFARF